MNGTKTTTCWITIGALLLATVGCQTMNENRATTGAVAGAVIGATAGALIDDSNPWRGALIGTAAGGLVGGAIGNVLRKQKEAFDRIDGIEAQQQTVVLQTTPPPTPENPQPAVTKEELPALVMNIQEEIIFGQGSSALSAAGSQRVRQIADVLKQYPDSVVFVRGYTSSEGDDKLNFELSQRRAEVVRNELAAAGVDPARIDAGGMGESNPIADNNTEAGRVMNRRVEVYVIPNQTASQAAPPA